MILKLWQVINNLVKFLFEILLIYLMSELKESKEDFAKKFMQEEGLKGKATRIKIIKIIDKVGFSKDKIKIALLRSTITERINHE